MTVEIGLDVELLKREIKKTYAAVSEEPEKDFVFPTGRAWALDLGCARSHRPCPGRRGRVVRRRC
jgi:hypothetical protein